MNLSTKNWVGQVTTGHGFMVLAPTLLAILSGAMSWQTALPLVIAGLVGLAWPENGPLKDAAQSLTTDMEAVFARYQRDTIAAAANAPTPPDPRPPVAGIAVLAATALSLAACGNQTPAQQAATFKAIECIASGTARVAVATSVGDSDMARTINGVTAVSQELATDPACSAALVSDPAPVKP